MFVTKLIFEPNFNCQASTAKPQLPSFNCQASLPRVPTSHHSTRLTYDMKTPPAFPRIFHGGDYNPEPWPESIRAQDMQFMRETHWNVATLPVFG
jgi:hypothetical protein